MLPINASTDYTGSSSNFDKQTSFKNAAMYSSLGPLKTCGKWNKAAALGYIGPCPLATLFNVKSNISLSS
jgi:hypothetical protein